MGMSNRAVPDSYRTYHTQEKNFLLNFDDHPDIRKYGEKMPSQPSFLDYQYDMANRHGVEPPQEADDDPMKGFGDPFIPVKNTSPTARKYLDSLKNLLLHQERPVEFQ